MRTIINKYFFRSFTNLVSAGIQLFIGYKYVFQSHADRRLIEIIEADHE
jgi:hypothetical protein